MSHDGRMCELLQWVLDGEILAVHFPLVKYYEVSGKVPFPGEYYELFHVFCSKL